VLITSTVTLLVLGGVGGIVHRRRRLRLADKDLAEIKSIADEEVTRLGEDIVALDIDMKSASVPEGTLLDYRKALDAYDRAKHQLGSVSRPTDLAAVSEALEAGCHFIALVRAQLAGDPPPLRRPPCFFDPRHGPSVADVAVPPSSDGLYGGVPACDADAQRIRDGLPPDVWTVAVGEQQMAHWKAGPAVSFWIAGYYRSTGREDLMEVGRGAGPWAHRQTETRQR
jgi:hypothetical protein